MISPSASITARRFSALSAARAHCSNKARAPESSMTYSCEMAVHNCVPAGPRPAGGGTTPDGTSTASFGFATTGNLPHPSRHNVFLTSTNAPVDPRLTFRGPPIGDCPPRRPSKCRMAPILGSRHAITLAEGQFAALKHDRRPRPLPEMSPGDCGVSLSFKTLNKLY
jgi:hypothetical protein